MAHELDGSATLMTNRSMSRLGSSGPCPTVRSVTLNVESHAYKAVTPRRKAEEGEGQRDHGEERDHWE
jgi:hypothetical protein